jgi:acid phosphatase (class A)
LHRHPEQGCPDLLVEQEYRSMLLPRRLLLAGGLSIALVVQAVAAEPYVTADMLDVATLLPPPPALGTLQDEIDLRAVLDAQAHASETRRAQAAADAKESVYDMFGSVMGDSFITTSLPKTTGLFQRIGASEGRIASAAKKVFNRPRPYMTHPEVKALAESSKSASYPSGHTTRVTTAAIVLTAMVPEKAREIWARAEDYGQSRVIAGVHYPTDVQAGIRTGTALATVLFQVSTFRDDFAAAKAELREVMGLEKQAAR